MPYFECIVLVSRYVEEVHLLRTKSAVFQDEIRLADSFMWESGIILSWSAGGNVPKEFIMTSSPDHF